MVDERSPDAQNEKFSGNGQKRKEFKSISLTKIMGARHSQVDVRALTEAMQFDAEYLVKENDVDPRIVGGKFNRYASSMHAVMDAGNYVPEMKETAISANALCNLANSHPALDEWKTLPMYLQAATFRTDRFETMPEDSDFWNEVVRKMHVLNCRRQGNLADAVAIALGFRETNVLEDFEADEQENILLPYELMRIFTKERSTIIAYTLADKMSGCYSTVHEKPPLVFDNPDESVFFQRKWYTDLDGYKGSPVQQKELPWPLRRKRLWWLAAIPTKECIDTFLDDDLETLEYAKQALKESDEQIAARAKLGESPTKE